MSDDRRLQDGGTMSQEQKLVTRIAAAWIELEQMVAADQVFKIGRTEESSVPALGSRYASEYPSEKIVSAESILKETPKDAEAAEKALIKLAWQKFPGRCINEQLGGGPIGGEGQHCVYVVVFRKSRSLINLAWEAALLRLMQEE